jgi:hypothetical protein
MFKIMARKKGNIVTHGLSGKIGGMLVFRQTATGTVVQPPLRTSGKATEAQLANWRKFQHAILYSNAVAGNPDMEAEYTAKVNPGQRVRNVA